MTRRSLPGSGRWHGCGPSLGPIVRPFALSVMILLALPSSSRGQDAASDFRWIPTRVDALRVVVDAIDQARQDGNDAGIREGLKRYATFLLDRVPDGGFPISAARWVGPAAYLEEIIGLLHEDLRARVLESIDEIVGARLGATTERAAPSGEFSLRVSRDFPRSSFSRATRELRANLLLEGGHIRGYLDFAKDAIDPALRRHLETLIEGDPRARTESFREPPWEILARLRWQARSHKASLWRDGVIRRVPLVVGDRIYVQGADKLRCLDRIRGVPEWETSYIENFPAPLHGSRLEPVQFRGLVVSANLTTVTAFDLEDGTIRWETPLDSLYPERGEGSSARVIGVTRPCVSERGLVISAVRFENGSVVGRLALLDEEGKPRWNRPAGSASGATYLGMGAVHNAVTVHGERAYFLTQRGFLSAFHLLDGALLWSAAYPSFGGRGSKDTLRFGDRFRHSELVADGGRLIGAPIDAAAVYGWNATNGELLFEIPRGTARWWHWDGNAATDPLALVSPDGATFWSVAGDVPELRGQYPVEMSSPVTGPPAYRGGSWWLPKANGYDRLSPWGNLQWSRGLTLPFRIENVIPCGVDRLFVGGSEQSVVLAPEATRASALAQQIRAARESLLEGSGSEVLSRLEALADLPGVDRATQLTPLAREVLAVARAEALGLSPEDFARAVRAALALMPPGREHAQSCYDRAVRAARGGSLLAATRLIYEALRSPLEVPVRVLPFFEVPLELACHRLLSHLRDALGNSTSTHEIDAEADRMLEAAKVGDTLLGYREIARRYPGTEAGRRASLELARKYYAEGNRDQALIGLRRVVLFEAETPEAVEARFRLAEILRDERQFDEARQVLTELRDRFGDSTLVTSSGEETVAERAQRVIDSLAKDPGLPEVARLDSTQLVPAWRVRTELLHQRTARVLPVSKFLPEAPSHEFLLIARRVIELRDARTGATIWAQRIPRRRETARSLLWPERGNFEEPAAILGGGIVITDGDEVFFLRLADGRPYWRLTLAPPADEETLDAGATAEDNPPHEDDAGGLPSRPAQENDASIRHLAAAGNVVLVAGSDGRLSAFDLLSGDPRWTTTIDGILVGPPQVRAGRFAVGTTDPPGVEIRSSANGAVLRTIPLNGDDLLVSAPRFLDDVRILVALKEGPLRAIHVETGETLWSLPLPAPAVAIHELPEVPFVVAQLLRSPRKPSLLGIDPADGTLLWTRVVRGIGQRILDLRCHDGDLYLLEEAGPDRKLTRLPIPKVFLRPGKKDLPAVEQLPDLWIRNLRGSWDRDVRLRFDGEWVLLEEHNRCDLTVLSRESGVPVVPPRFKLAQNFLENRRRLFFSGFVGDTFVVFTRNGGMGFRAMAPMETENLAWRSLLDLDPLAPDAERLGERGAYAAYRTGRIEDACGILERTLESPGLTAGDRARAATSLEGIAQQLGEENPLAWTAHRLPAVPLIDGSLDEPWTAGTALALTSPRFFHPMQGMREDASAWRGWRDLSALIVCGWTDVGFHLAIDVTDDRVHPYDRQADRWVGDCLLIAFDFLGDGGISPGRDDQLLTLALTVPRQQPKQGEEDADEAEGEGEEDQPEGEFQVQRKSDGSGVIYEVTVPWETFRNARRERDRPVAEMEFGMNLVVTDDDTGRGAASYLSLSSGQMLREETRNVWNLFAPEYFARIQLKQ